jgi:5-methylthioribose kinase
MTFSPDEVPAFLRARALSAAADNRWTVTQLTGGVSGSVFSAFDGSQRFVVKQSLGKLAVTDDWTAPRERILNEARVLQIVGDTVPDHSPTVLDVDEASLTITMEHAPEGWSDWKSELLAGAVDTRLAADLGRSLGSIHASTASRTWHVAPDDGASVFLALRIEPFHYTIADRMPELADSVLEVAARTLARRECLVHGDFSPKNILVAPKTHAEGRGFWIIDDEVGHRGDPTFDVAFLMSHLALKSIRAGQLASSDLSDAGVSFLAGYAEKANVPKWQELAQQIGCMMLGRIVGRSPVNYLNDNQRRLAVNAGTKLLLNPDQFDPSEPFSRMEPDTE